MEIIADTTQFYLERDTAVAIGKFDGLHIGHRRLLDEILEQKKNGLAACVFTFDPAPAVLFGASDGRELMTREEKRAQLERMGVDILVEFPLSMQTAAIEPEVFVSEILAKQMNVRFIAAGTDLSFGAKGRGNAELLQQKAGEFDYQVKTIDKVKYGDREISSTYVREQVEAGNMLLVEQLLGRPYTIMGTVVHGNRIGRTLGMPTVNVLPPENKLMPPCGVYYSRVWHRGKRYCAISNVGYKPTVTNERVMGVEAYIYDFHEEIYGEEIEIGLLEFRRPEQKFAGLEELKKQLAMDIEAGGKKAVDG